MQPWGLRLVGDTTSEAGHEKIAVELGAPSVRGSACLANARKSASSPYTVLAQILTTPGCGTKTQAQDSRRMYDGSRTCCLRHFAITGSVSVPVPSVSTTSRHGSDRS